MKKIIRSILTALCSLSFSVCCLSLLTCCSSDGKTGEHVHDLSRVSERPATCKEEGNITYWTCDCGAFFSDEAGTEKVTEADVKLAKGEHVLTNVKGIEPTCISNGRREYWSCSVCQTNYADEACTEELKLAQLLLAKGKHKLTHHEEIPVEGKENGVMEHWTCSTCDDYFADAEGTEKITEADTVLVSVMGIPDFIVEVETGRDPVVLQLTDPQIIDAEQARPGREGVDKNFWGTDKVEERCYDYITETINAADPDFIIITGDIVYGEFDDAGTAFVSFIEFMESFKIPWSPVFGNHDNESAKGVDWQCEQLENAEYCLFEQKTLSGNGNYSVGIAQDGELKRVFYMLDSNGCGGASAASLANGHTKTSVGFGRDQINWYTEEITEIKQISPDTKISFAYHIQQAVFADAYEKYGFDQSQKYQDINIDTLPNKAEGDFGYLGRQMKAAWDTDYSVWNGMKALGTDSVFVGHEHCNSASVVYEGVRFQYGQKSSEYDRFNCLNSDGSITGGYSITGVSLIGGTVIPLSEADGSIKSPYIYLCGGVDIGGNEEGKEPEITVGGLQYGGVNATSAEMYADGAVTAKGVVFDETTNAYEVTANTQGKLYLNVALLQGKTKFTFSVYLPSTSTNTLAGMGEFAIRVKPNGSEPSQDGEANGYIDFDSSASDPALKLEFGKWQTFTVDITGLSATCTEFAFNIASGNVLYLKDVAFH